MGLGVTILTRACVTRIAQKSGRRWKVVVTHPHSLRAETQRIPKASVLLSSWSLAGHAFAMSLLSVLTFQPCFTTHSPEVDQECNRETGLGRLWMSEISRRAVWGGGKDNDPSTLGAGEVEVQLFCHCMKNSILCMNSKSSDNLPSGAEDSFHSLAELVDECVLDTRWAQDLAPQCSLSVILDLGNKIYGYLNDWYQQP